MIIPFRHHSQKWNCILVGRQLIQVLNWRFYPQSIRNVARITWNTVLKAREKHTQARNNESSDGAGDIVDTNTPRMTGHTLVNETDSVLYPCHSDVQLYRPTCVIEMAAITIDMIRTNHSSTESAWQSRVHTSGHSWCSRYQWSLKVGHCNNWFPEHLRVYKFPL